MDVFETVLIDILKLSVAGSIVFALVYICMRPYLYRLQALRSMELQNSSKQITLPLRLQAYERIVLFLERINPANLSLRIPATGLNVASYQQLLVTEIREEFQHNVAQQIYVDAISWKIVLKLKTETIAMINNAAMGMPAESDAADFRKKIVMHLAHLESDPYASGAEMIRGEISRLF